ncbi:hypothetical protein ACLK1S_02335 [Escherichia coli]
MNGDSIDNGTEEYAVRVGLGTQFSSPRTSAPIPMLTASVVVTSTMNSSANIGV